MFLCHLLELPCIWDECSEPLLLKDVKTQWKRIESDVPTHSGQSRGLDVVAVMYGDDETLSVERCTKLDLSVKKKITTKIPFPTLHCLLLIRLRGKMFSSTVYFV